MITLALMSTTGGAGRSSLAVAMAHHLSLLGRKVRLVQLDPSNNLAFELGLSETQIGGLCSAVLNGTALSDELLPNERGFEALPFGRCTADEEFRFLEMCQNRPAALIDVLAANMADQDILILDLPRWPNLVHNPVLQMTDLNLVVLSPDPLSVIALDALLPKLLESRGASYFLMNRFDSTKVLHLDLWTLCKTKLGHRLLPFYFHEDQALPESVAAGLPLADYAPHSQLLEDHQKLCNWIDSEIQ